MYQESFKKYSTNNKFILSHRKARLGFTRNRGTASAFIFDPALGLPKTRWTGDQPTPLVQRIR